MTRLARAFARRPMLLLWQDFGVSRPEVRVEQAHLEVRVEQVHLVRLRDTLPQNAAGRLIASADSVSVCRQRKRLPTA